MSAISRIGAEAGASYRSFLRRRTAVFFTFFFPVLLIVIFAGLVRTGGGGTGLFSKSPGYYVPAYLAVVVLFTPLSRLGSTVARHREGARFEKLSTTPLRAWEWLAAHTLVNVALIAIACTILVVALKLTGADFSLSPWLVLFVPTASVLFCGIGAVIGGVADSQDGAISMSNGIALPLLFLSDTFISTTALPDWFAPLLNLSPLTYFARGLRAATYTGGSPVPEFAITLVLAVLAFAVGVYAIPWTAD